MKWGKVLFAAVAATVFNAIYGIATCGWLFKWIYAIEPTNVWKPESAYTGAFWAKVYIGSLILWFFFAAAYGLINKVFTADCSLCKGAAYGLIIWLVGMLPGMWMTYSFMTVSYQVVIYWTISGLVSLMISGMIVAAIYGKKECSCCCG